MSTRWPRIPTGKPGSIANKIFSKNAENNNRKTSNNQFFQDKNRNRNKNRGESPSRRKYGEVDHHYDRSRVSVGTESSSESFESSRNSDFSDRDMNRDNNFGLNMENYLQNRGKFQTINVDSPRSDNSIYNSNSLKSNETHNHYVPFNPKKKRKEEDGGYTGSSSLAWSDSNPSNNSNSYSNRRNLHIPDNFVIKDIDKSSITKDNNGPKSSLTICVVLIVLAIIVLIVALILIIVFFGPGASSSAVTLGPGDNSPCVQYSQLDQAWRQIGRRPLSPGVGYNCDRNLVSGRRLIGKLSLF